MNFERLKKVQSKTYSEEDFYYDLLTELGASLHAYMTMLSLAGREEEARLLETARTHIFAARNAGFPSGPDAVLRDLLRTCWGLDNHYAFLQAARPQEAVILQSPANTALWVANLITSRTTFA